MGNKLKFLASQPGYLPGFITAITVGIVCVTKILKKVVSPWDELYHLAYVQYMYNFNIPQPGNELLSWSKYAFTCFPVHPYGFTTALSCGTDGPPEAFPAAGRNVAAIWPPIYYALTSTWMRLFGTNDETALFIARSFSTFVWSIGAGLFCYTLIARNKLNKETAVAISLLVAILPMGIFQSVFVTPYSLMLILVSGLYLIATSKYSMSFKGLNHIVVFATISLLAIPHIFPVVFFLTLRMLFKYWVENEKRSKVFIFFILCTSIIPFDVIALWQKIQESRQLEVVMPIPPLNPFTLDQLPRALFTFIPHSIDGYQFMDRWQSLISYILSILFLVLLLKPLMGSTSPTSAKLDAFLLLSISCVFGVLYQVAFGFTIPPRYGLPLIFVSFFIITRGGISVILERTFKSLALLGLLATLLGPVFNVSS